MNEREQEPRTAANLSTPAAALEPSMKRNLLLLASCQAVGQSASIMMLTVTALAVVSFYPNRDLATLPVTFQHFGVMLGVFPAAMLMQWRGRRLGFQFGSIVGIAGAFLSGFGLYIASFPLMCLGGVLLGYSVANLQMYRFAAMELVPINYRAKAASWVTAGGVVSGMVGPALTTASYDTLVPIYLGTYVAMMGVHVVVFMIMAFIQFAPVHEEKADADPTPARPLWEIVQQTRFLAAVIAGMTAYGTMSFVMAASPLAIVGCGLPNEEVQWVIFLHVMGMFVPSFFTGHLITKYGVLKVMAWGAAILLAGALIAYLGIDRWNFRLALAANGVGWNFMFIGATVVVSNCYRASERGKTQALNDFLVFGTTSSSSFLAGFVQERMGWASLNQSAIVLILIAAVAVAWLALQQKRTARI